MCEKNSAKKKKNMRQNREKWPEKSVKNTVKNAQKCEKCSAGTAGRTNFEREKESRNFSRFSGQAVSSPSLEGVRFMTHGAHFRGIVGADAGVCICPLLASSFPG